MAGAEIKLESASIVLRGSFNPAIFQPRWFSAQGLLSDEAADAAEIQVIHPQIAAFAVHRIDLQVTTDRFMVASADAASYDLLRDLVLGTFAVLKHTPLSLMGLNSSAHMRSSSESAWHNFGHMLAPKTFWDGLVEKPGTRSLTIQGDRPDKHKGYLLVKVEPSNQVQPGVFVDINDHFEAGGDEPGAGWAIFSDIVKTEWESSRDRANALIEKIRGQL